MGLYGGLTVEGIHDKKGLAIRDKILDHMGSEELIATPLLYLTDREQAETRRYTRLNRCERAFYCRALRAAIERVGGTMPEDLPVPDKSISQIEREQLAALKAKTKKKPLMLDE